MINKTLVKKPIVLDDEVEYESDNDSEEMSNDLDNKLNNRISELEQKLEKYDSILEKLKLTP